MPDDLSPRTIISRCSAGPRLIAENPKSWEWESFPRIAVRPRYRQRALAPWQSTYSMVPEQEKG
jgi:hypothetical protein